MPQSLMAKAVRWFASWSIEQRVLGGFGLVFAGIVVISIASYRNTAVLIENSRLDTRRHELVQLLGSIGETLDEAERGHRRYLVIRHISKDTRHSWSRCPCSRNTCGV